MTETASTSRLPASERRAGIVDAALGVFGSGSYCGSTTAEIARAAGVTEPVIYRHFSSKRALWFACVDEAWSRLRTVMEDNHRSFAESGPEGLHRSSPWTGSALPTLWLQGVTSATDDDEIRTFVRSHVREVHDFVAASIRRGMESGAVPADRDADAESWIFLGGGMLHAFDDHLGGAIGEAEFAAISRERYRWLLGE